MVPRLGAFIYAGLILTAASGVAWAQDASTLAPAPAPTASPTPAVAPPASPPAEGMAPVASPDDEGDNDNRKAAAPANAALSPPPPPPGPARPVRSPTAVLQVLDKVTAETLRFAAPIGRRVRYKSLIVEARACETRPGVNGMVRSSAYLLVDALAASTSGGPPVSRQVFKGWMFADQPAAHALEHPVYDLWLVACGG